MSAVITTINYCSNPNSELMLQPKNVKCNFTHMRKISLLKMMNQEAHITSVIVLRLYSLSCLKLRTLFWKNAYQ